MIRFYFHPTPNPAKVALFLEEVGLAYETIPVERARAVGKDHPFKRELDEEARRALFPSNYPSIPA